MSSKIFWGFNFKENVNTLSQANDLLDVYLQANLKSEEVVMFLPFPFLFLGKKLEQSGIHLGSQDVSSFEFGNYTGEVSSQMLVELGVKYCLIGHSEVRSIQKLSDLELQKKLQNCLKFDLKPVLCVGYEPHPKAGCLDEQNLIIQIEAFLKVIPSDYNQKLVWAFEPTFAIGSGVVASSEQIQKAIDLISAKASNFENQILYGGSVSSQTLPEFLKITRLGGFLVGKNSLQVEEIKTFLDIDKNQ